MALSARCDAVLLHWLSNLPFKLKESMEDSRLLKSASQAYLLQCVTAWGQTQSQHSQPLKIIQPKVLLCTYTDFFIVNNDFCMCFTRSCIYKQ